MSDTVEISPHSALTLQLAQERVAHARALAAQREAELQFLLTEMRHAFEENGKYEVISVDPAKGTLSRTLKSVDSE